MKSAWKSLVSILTLTLIGIAILQPVAPTIPAGYTRNPGTGIIQDGSNKASRPVHGEVIVSDPILPSVTDAVRDLPLYEPEYYLDREINPRLNLSGNFFDGPGGIAAGVDPLLSLQENAPPPSAYGFTTPILNFDGQGYTGVNPPDTVGDVGSNHYIQMINGSGGGVFSIYDKSGTLVSGPTSLDSMGSGACGSGWGDPIALYDRLADRWLLSEFAGSGNHLCVYVSQTPDPTGPYYAYDFPTPNFPDYPKYAVWPDAYYVSSNENSPAAYALDRNQMLVGGAATSQRFTAPDLSGFGFQALTPSDLDGAVPPPAGSPNYFMRHRDTEAHGPGGILDKDILEIWEFHVDWVTPGNSSLSGPTSIEIAEIDSGLCGFSSFNCFPQPGSGTTLDPLREVIMWRLQYRNFGDYETLVGNLVTDVDGSDHGGVRWFELRKTGVDSHSVSWSLFQEGTYAPDSSHRWMGAIAMDGSGNIALGYNVSDATTVYPSLRYVGRLSSDPLGTLPQGEVSLVAGASPNSSNRYGDYSAMSVDPADDCTFWFTGEYNQNSTWSTRIGTFKFDECSGGIGHDFTLAASPQSRQICTPDDATYTIEVGQMEGFGDQVTLSVIDKPAGTSVNFSTNPVTPSDPPATSTLTIGNTGGASADNYQFTIVGVAPTKTHTFTLGLDIYDSTPGVVTPTLPADGAINVPTMPSFTWDPALYADTYLLEVAAGLGFSSIVYSATVEGTSHTSNTSLDPMTIHYWRVSPNNVCGYGASSDVFAFTTRPVPSILLVDDDDNDPDVSHYYTETLDTLGLNYDIWDTNNSDVEPSASTLAPYSTVLWFSGGSYGGETGPGINGEAALGTWLDAGNCLFISSQDYHYDQGLTSFMQSYLGVDAVSDDDGYYKGVAGRGTVFGGMGPYLLSYPFSDYSDIVTTDGTAEIAFQGNNGNIAAINKDAGSYRTTYWSFPFEAMPPGDLNTVMTTVLDWCGTGIATGILEGTVMNNASNEIIVGALVTAADGSVQKTALTNANGEYSMTLAVGMYDVIAAHMDYLTRTVNGVVILTASITLQDFSLVILPRAGVSVTPRIQVQVGSPGDVVTHTFKMKNTGNVTDTYTLTVGGNNWSTISPIIVGPLSPNETASVDVLVTIPVDPLYSRDLILGINNVEEPGKTIAKDRFILRATSGLDPSVYRRGFGKTKVEVDLAVTIFPPRQSKTGSPGDVLSYSFTLTNTGDFTDSYTLKVFRNNWPTVVAPSFVGPLGPGESATLAVSVTIPTTDVIQYSELRWEPNVTPPQRDRFIVAARSSLSSRLRAKGMGRTIAVIRSTPSLLPEKVR